MDTLYFFPFEVFVLLCLFIYLFSFQYLFLPLFSCFEEKALRRCTSLAEEKEKREEDEEEDEARKK